jgi:hypothetical protein
LFSKAAVRIAVVGLATLGISSGLARPALAALKYGTYELSQFAASSRLFECEALVISGIGFIGLAFLVRRWQASAE